MRPGRYAHFPSSAAPRAAIDLSSETPARYYARMLSQTLRYGLPARRPRGALYAWVGRRGLPERTGASVLRRFSSHARPDLDRLLADLTQAWPELAGASARLPPQAPPLSALALTRRSALTVLVFGGSDHPLLVAKIPVGLSGPEAERLALEEAATAAVAPRFLGRVGPAYVQEGLVGAPLEVVPLDPDSARHLEWSAGHRELAAGLERLAARTAKAQLPEELHDPIERALEWGGLGAQTRRLLAGAWRDVAKLAVSVLRHRDTSPQNCLLDGDRLTGLVDWENAVSNGAPGFDAWNAAIAFLEHGVGLARWSEERVLEVFEAGWFDSPFGRAARPAARATALAAEVPERRLDSLEICFLGRRLGRRLAAPEGWATSPRTVARMLELACAR